MKLVVIIFLLLSIMATYAQEPSQAKTDSLFAKLDSLSIPNLRFAKADTLQVKWKSKADSLAVVKNKLQHKLDSLNPLNRIEQQKQKLIGITSKLSLPDSLQYAGKLDKYNKKIDSTRLHLQTRLDSLSHLKLDVSQIKMFDSLRLKLDSLKASGPLKDLKQAETKLADLQQKVNGKLTAAEMGINEKISQLSQQGLTIPGVNLPDAKLNLPGANLPGTSLHGALGLNTDLKIPEFKLPTGNSLNLNPSVDTNPGENLNLNPETKLKTPSVKELSRVKDLQTDFEKIGEVATDIKGYQQDVQKIREGGFDDLEQLPEKAEEKALDIVGDEFKQRAAMVEKWKSDPAYAKELALNAAKEQSVNHFAGKEEQLKAAMEQLGKLKSKYHDAEGVLDLFQKKQHPLKGKPVIERIAPGLNIQVQAGTHIWIDFNPYVGYQISRRFTAGLGWNERLSVDFKELEVISDERIYGPRSFLEFKIKDNLVLKGEIKKEK